MSATLPVPASPGPPAGFWIRFVAYVIDALIFCLLAGIMIGVYAAIVALSGGKPKDELPAGLIALGVLMALAYIAMAFLYEILLTASPRGGTLGKQALGLRVVRDDGAQLSLGRSTARYFLKIIITPMLPLAIGYLLAAFTTRKQALHDMAADTLVIRTH